jgi:hypothetical protein
MFGAESEALMSKDDRHGAPDHRGAGQPRATLAEEQARQQAEDRRDRRVIATPAQIPLLRN